ncbi:MAG: methylmalonyl Co-A mutase-associated GTPase MeaB [Rhodocyclaceae bacterium]|nr:methylmalonyl Co-A mutase-associated GTPase MeaB [Rhodocyclaceae bacterium]
MSEPLPLTDADRSLVAGVLGGNRRALAKAITLVESKHPEHRVRAAAVLDALLPHTGKSLRIGLTGVPGAGKSTFIEAFGLHLIGQGLKVAVLAVDPSSSVTGGSIMGDKTRMERLSQSEAAYIRPSPAGGALGGVAAKTREALFLCEAAGYDVVIVETVGVGQSETLVAGMTDVFVLLQLPNAGDDLQAIKKGIMELADLVIYNKADLDAAAAERAAMQMRSALALLQPASSHWQPRVMQVSALRGEGIEAVWAALQEYRRVMTACGELEEKRRRQALDWMWQLIDAGLRQRFREHPAVRALLPDLTRAVAAGEAAPTAAAERLLSLLNRYF